MSLVWSLTHSTMKAMIVAKVHEHFRHRYILLLQRDALTTGSVLKYNIALSLLVVKVYIGVFNWYSSSYALQ